jgi:hypothetical protein
MGLKAAERALRNLRLDGLVRTHEFAGHRKLYGPTAKLARARGLDERRFRRSPGDEAVGERYLLALYCVRYGHQLLTPGEFRAAFPEAASAGTFAQTRYYVDLGFEQPRLTLIVPDHASGDDPRRLATRVRRSVELRKKEAAWRDLIFNKLLAIVVVTATEARARRVTDSLRHVTFPFAVVAMPELTDLV